MTKGWPSSPAGLEIHHVNLEAKAVKAVLRACARLSVAAVGVAVSVLLAAVRLLACSTETTPADDELNSSIRGGLLNYRTGKFDDGTDPAGIYKPD